VLVQSSSSSRARSKRVRDESDHVWCSDPLVVHVLLLTHEFMYNVICLPHYWYPQCDGSATWSSCAQNTQMMILLLWFNAVGWSWQMLDCFYWLSAAFFPFQDFFAGATSLVLQQQISQFCTCFTYAVAQPSSRTFWVMAYCKLCKLLSSTAYKWACCKS
jgi:hypothetical protein